MWGDGFGGLGVGMSLMVSLFSLSLHTSKFTLAIEKFRVILSFTYISNLVLICLILIFFLLALLSNLNIFSISSLDP
jgi:hypothetical protein